MCDLLFEKDFISVLNNINYTIGLFSNDCNIVYINPLGEKIVLDENKDLKSELKKILNSNNRFIFESHEFKKLSLGQKHFLVIGSDAKNMDHQLSLLTSIAENDFYCAWITDAENKALFFNDSFQKIFERLSGRKPELGQQTDLLSFYSALKGTSDAKIALPEGKSGVIEIPVVSYLGEKFRFELCYNIIKEGDKVVGITYLAKDITPRYTVETQLDTARARFEAIVNGLPNGLVIVVEKDRTYSFFEGTELKRFTLNSSQFFGKKVGVVTSGQSLQAYQKAIESAFSGLPQSVEISLLNDQLFYHVSAMPLVENGAVERVLLIAINTTERKLNEQKVQESEELLRKWFNSNVIGHLIWNIDGTILDANPAFLNMLGYTEQEVVNLQLNAFQVTSSSTFENSRQAIEQLLSGAPSVTYQKEYIAKDSRIIPVEVTISFFEGRKDRGFSYIRNLSEIKQVENQLKIAESRYVEVVNMQKELIVRILLDGTILYANPSFCKIFAEHQNLIGKHLGDVFSRTEFEVFDSMVSTVLELKKTATFEDCYQDNSLWITWNLSPVLLDGKPIEIQCVGVDISHIKWAEAKIVEQNKLLQESNNRLQKLNDNLDGFVAKVSHDLRSPLASIRGILELVNLSNQDPTLNEYLDLMKTSVKKLENFITDILDLAKSSKLEPKKEQIDLQVFFNDILGSLRYAENAEKVEKIFKIETSSSFFSDKQRLGIIFSNLIGNSIRYANLKRSDCYVKITAHVSPQKAVFEIEDNGIGIEEKHQTRIFDMFYRANDSKTGTGLGLYIVKEAVEKLGGNIKLHSQPEVGSTFTITLPNSK